MLMSKNKCSPSYPTIRAWSGKMRDLGLRFRYWQTYFRHQTKKNISPVTLYKCTQNAGITHKIKTTQEITSESSKLRTDIREMKKNTRN